MEAQSDQLKIFQDESKKSKNLKLVDSQKFKGRKSYYQIMDPDNLSAVGLPYLEDFRRGIKNFAFCSTNYKASQQRTIVALASYFEHLFDLKILIVSDSLLKGMFKDFIRAGKNVRINLNHPDLNAEIVQFYHHFDFFDIGLERSYTKEVMQNVLSQYDLIFWDTPMLSQHHETHTILKKIAHNFESVSIVVPPSASRGNGIEELKKHFESFGINIAGVLLKNMTGLED